MIANDRQQTFLTSNLHGSRFLVTISCDKFTNQTCGIGMTFRVSINIYFDVIIKLKVNVKNADYSVTELNHFIPAYGSRSSSNHQACTDSFHGKRLSLPIKLPLYYNRSVLLTDILLEKP